MIIVPAICKEKDSPFGEPDLCYQYGMTYAVLSMAVCKILILKLHVLNKINDLVLLLFKISLLMQTLSFLSVP